MKRLRLREVKRLVQDHIICVSWAPIAVGFQLDFANGWSLRMGGRKKSGMPTCLPWAWLCLLQGSSSLLEMLSLILRFCRLSSLFSC